MTWVALGSNPGRVFGFSVDTAELGTASVPCSNALKGNVTLATLDTMFDEVMEYLQSNNDIDGKTFWLDAERSEELSGFRK